MKTYYLFAYIYNLENGTTGMGRTILGVDGEVTMTTIDQIEKYIRKDQNFADVGIIGFYKLAKEEKKSD